MSLSTPILEASRVSFEYPGKRALDEVSFALYPGSVTALVGPNGSGKTTLLRCLAALDQPFAGTIRVGGFDTVVDPRSCHEFVGYLSDNFGLYDDLSVNRCLLHQGAIYGLRGAALDAAVRRVVTQLDLENLLAQRAGSLSKGQRQRLGIALTLLPLPKVLLLDEPAAGLDPEARGDLSTLFGKLRGEGLCILVSSHILAELEDYSDRMLTLKDGRILGDEFVGLTNHTESVSLVVDLLVESARLAEILLEHDGVSDVQISTTGATLRFTGSPELRAALLRRLVTEEIPVLHFAVERTSLEAVYRRQVEERKNR